jgi:outer membrane protein
MRFSILTLSLYVSLIFAAACPPALAASVDSRNGGDTPVAATDPTRNPEPEPRNDSPAPRILNLPDCLTLTLGYSRDVLIADEARQFSKGRYVEERAAALPHAQADANAIRLHDNSFVLPGISGKHNQFGANLNLTQALFTWGQIGAAIRAAEHDREATDQQLQEARQLAMRETAVTFYDLLLAIELEVVARDNLAQKQRVWDEARKKHQMEVATDYDVLAAEVEVTNAQPTVTRAANTIRLARDRLRYYMGVQGDFDISGSLSCTLTPPAPLAEVLKRAQANRPEVAFYESRVGVFKELTKVAKGGDKPRLDFKGNVGRIAIKDVDSSVPGGYWDAGVYLSFPFFDGLATRGRVMQARSQLATTELEMKRLLDQIALDARDSINQVDESIQIVKGLEASVTQAERLLKMAEAGYQYGVKTKLEVDDAQLNYLQARVNLARARRDYLSAWTRLQWIMGEDLQNALANPAWGMCKP